MSETADFEELPPIHIPGLSGDDHVLAREQRWPDVKHLYEALRRWQQEQPEWQRAHPAGDEQSEADG